MKKIIIILILISGTLLSSITLEEAKKIGLKNNLDYQNTINNQKIAKVQKYQAYSAILPQATTNANFSDSEPGMENETYGYQITQPVFQSGKILFGMTLARNNEKIAKNNSDQSKIKLLSDIEIKYYNSLRQKKQLKIAEQNLIQAEKNLESAKIKYDIGNISQTDFLQFKLNLSEKENSFLTQKNNYEISLQSFANFLNIEHIEIQEINKNEILTEINKVANLNIKEIEAKISIIDEISQKENLSLKNSKNSINNSKSNLKISQFSYLPDINLTYQSNWSKNELQNDFQDSEQIGLNFSFSVFPLVNETSSLLESKYKLENAKNNYQSLSKNIQLDIRNNLYNLITAAKSVLSEKISIEQATALYEKSEIKFNLGELSAVDFLNASISLENSKSQFQDKFYQYLENKSKIKTTISETSDEKINKILFN